MTDTDTSLSIDGRPADSTIRRIVGVALALGGLLVVLGLAAALPGLDRLLAGLAVAPVALLTGVATLFVVAALVWLAPTVEHAVEQSVDGPPAALPHVAAGANRLVGFVAVVVAYHGFAPAVTPLFDAFGLLGVYHLGFLVVGLAVLAAFTYRLVRCWRPVTSALTARLTATHDDTGDRGVTTR